MVVCESRAFPWETITAARGLLMALGGGSWIELSTVGALIIRPPIALEGKWPFRLTQCDLRLGSEINRGAGT
ncbi:MAG: hypothetical protein ABJB74_18445 [Gemmatimonas sp.]